MPEDINANYVVGRTLGSGACGVVSLVYNIKTCGEFAMKRVDKVRNLLRKKVIQDPAKIMNEVKIMKSLQHPGIVQMVDIVETPTEVFVGKN